MNKNIFYWIPGILFFLIFLACQPKSNSASANSKEIANQYEEDDDDDDISETSDAEVTPKFICSDENFDFEKTILQLANNLSGYTYSRDSLTDCSGMFHKMLSGLGRRCSNAKFPKIGDARSTRGIAKWYEEKDALHILRDPINQSDLIQPGAVMFYGYGWRLDKNNYETMTIDTLAKQDVGINHVAVVTSVNRVNGELESYEIFHGRNPSEKSGITDSKKVNSDPKLPPYGNYDEPWLAVANIWGMEIE